MIKSIRNKGLRRFAENSDASKLSVQNADRVRRILVQLEAAKAPRNMDQPGCSSTHCMAAATRCG